MKNSFLILALLISIFEMNAQKTPDSNNYTGFVLKSWEIGGGETSFGGNVATSFRFTKGKKVALDFIYKDHLVCFIGNYVPVKNLSLGISGGYLNNTPWSGPLINTSFFNGMLTTQHWLGFCNGNPDKETTEANFGVCFSYQKIKFSHNLFFADYNWFSIYYAAKNYRTFEKTTHVVCLNQNWKLNNYVTAGFEEGYMFEHGCFDYGKFLWSGKLNFDMSQILVYLKK